MYKIVGITDSKGNSKVEAFDYIKENHSLYGYLTVAEVNLPFTFEYDDESGQMLRSSYVKDYEYIENDKLHIITTMNSIYYIKECD